MWYFDRDEGNGLVGHEIDSQKTMATSFSRAERFDAAELPFDVYGLHKPCFRDIIFPILSRRVSEFRLNCKYWP
jgi:hypothetical protein